MLILKRKKNESLIIGDSIEIQITDIQGDSVKLGITAPKEVSIYREEVYQRIKELNIQSAGLDQNTIDGIDNILSENT